MNKAELIKAIAEEIAKAMVENIGNREITNGEVLKALFPNMKVHEYIEKVVLNGLGDEFQIQSMAWKNWWDSPYKGVSE